MVYLKTLHNPCLSTLIYGLFKDAGQIVRIFREWRIGSKEKGNQLSLISRRISEFALMSEENHKNSQHNRYLFRDSIRLLFEIVCQFYDSDSTR
jgi:hypothetical protein